MREGFSRKRETMRQEQEKADEVRRVIAIQSCLDPCGCVDGASGPDAPPDEEGGVLVVATADIWGASPCALIRPSVNGAVTTTAVR